MKLINSVRVGKKGQIVIPGYIRKNLELRENSILTIFMDEDRVVLIPANKIGQMTRGMLKGTWGSSKEEIEKYVREERKSWERNY